jgi:hypothetical protein
MTYYYPIVTGGYRWNMLRRCLLQVGLEPIAIGDAGEQTYLTFSRELTQGEQSNLDTLMADNPTFPPSTGVRVLIRDLWEEWDQFKVACGLPNLQIFYHESTTGSGKVDRIQLWHPTPLTQAQKDTVRNTYRNLWIG